ncbi:PGF-pre-PGF domain-containing protein [Methanofollis aquaemaris]|uniref:PGF-pre-PGF domain-containing protein n=1 Tax=Methanofollis aquaemaris TaxID=126734 RepID=A0A8A3S6A2_9EURY|nr:right-handed parallel beta-helix repeat-containing protein [Methanofollis aquaemaris]QSZ67807.1 PGF-pre-PGF domain-containing protein [Methanofollis aquaemaris]
MEKKVTEIIINPSNVFRILICVSILGYLVSGVAASPPPYSVNATGWWNETGVFNPAPANPIQAALTNASAGSVVTVTEQTSYSSPLVFDAKSITLDLNGSRLDGSRFSDRPGITLANAVGVTIKNGEITSFQDGILFKGSSSGVSISGITITAPGKNGIWFGGKCENAIFSNITITDPGQAGIREHNSGSLGNLTFQDCTVIGAGSDGIALDDCRSNLYGTCYVRNLVLSNVTVRNAAANGIILEQDATTQSGNLTVRDCTVEGAGQYGVRVIGRGEVVIEDIQSRGNGDSGVDGTYYGLYLKGIEAPDIALLNLTVENNRNGLYLENVADLLLDGGVTIQGNGGYACALKICDNITVRDHDFDPAVRPYLHGVYTSSVTNSTFENLTISGNTGDAIVFDGISSGLTFDTLTITAPGKNGIYFNGNCANVALSNITITDPTLAGITKNVGASSLANITVRDCTVTGAGDDGIALDDYRYVFVRDIVLSNVTVRNATGNGILIGQDNNAQSGNVTVHDCTVERAGEYGVRVLGREEVILEDVQARGNGDTSVDNVYYGLSLTGYETPTVSLLNLTIEDNRNGLYLEKVADLVLGTEIAVRDNGGYACALKICDNITFRDHALDPTVRSYLHGLYLSSVTNSTIANLTVVGAAGNAVFFDGTSSSIVLDTLTITAPGKNGIYFYGNCANAALSNITITDPALSGITKDVGASSLASITVRDCTVTGAGGDGIALDDYRYVFVRDVVVSNVTVRNATGNGILIGQDNHVQSGNLTVRDCTVERAGQYGVRILGRGEIVLDGVQSRGNGDKNGDNVYYGLSLTGYEMPTISLLNLTVEDNRNGLYLEKVADLVLGTGIAVRDNGGYACALKICDNITFRDHALDPTVRPYLRGLYLSSMTNSTFENLTISGNTGDAIVFDGISSGLTLDTLTITTPGKNGIWFNGNCANTVFSNITINDPKQAGVTKNGRYSSIANLTIRDSTVTGADGDGIALDDYSSDYVRDIVLSNVTAINVTRNGILVGQDNNAQSGSVTVRDCTVEGSGQHGVLVLGREKVVIDGVRARGNGESSGDGTYYGLSLKGIGVPDVTLLNLAVERNRNGFYLEGVSDLLLDDGIAVRDNGGYAYVLKTCDNVSVRDLAATPAVRSYTRGLHLSAVTDSSFENLTFSGSTGDALWLEGTSAGLAFDSIKIVSPGTNGIYFNGNCKDTVFSNLTITDPAQAGISKYYKYITLENLTVRDCTVSGAGGDGIVLGDYSSSLRDIVLSNLTVRNVKGTGIILGQDNNAQSENVTVRDCTVEGSGKHGIDLRGRGEVVIDGIEARDNGETGGDNTHYGLSLRGIETPAVTLLDITVEKNRNGFYLEGVSDLLLDDGIAVRDNGGYVYVLKTCDNVSVRDLAATPAVRSYTRGLHLSAVTDCSFENLTFSGSTGDALWLEGTSAGLAFDAITITNPGINGIYFNGNCRDTVFSNLTITDPAQAGISKYYKYITLKNLTIRDCTVTGAGTGGIALDDYYSSVRDLVLANLTVRNATGTGITLGQDSHAESMNLTLLDCTVEGSGTNGIDLRARGDVRILDCEASGNAQTGMVLIGIERPFLVFENATITGNNQAMQITGINATITDSALAGTTGDLDLRGEAHITLSNTTHDRAKVTLDGTSRLAVLWPLIVTTTDLTGNIVAGADVTVADVNGTVALTAQTNADGRTGPHLLREYTRNGTAPAVLSTPYTLTASAPIGSASDATDLSGPTTVTLRLFQDTKPPTITYVAPTPEEGARSPANVTVKVLVTDDVGVAGALLEVNGVNATMTLDRTRTGAYASANITGDGIHRYRIYANDSAGNMNVTGIRSVGISTTPPPGVTDLAATTVSETAITWTWTDPADPTFDRVMLFLNGTFLTNVPAGVGTYTTTGLAPDTAYLLTTRSVDFCGQANATRVNATVRTAPDRTPPAGVTDLTAATISETAITWTWTDPADADFDQVMLTLDGTFITNISAGVGTYTTTGLAPDTEYQIGTRTVDTAGNINQTWVNATARTAPDRTPPAGVTDLAATTISETAITWTWTDPADADFAAVRVYWDGANVEVPTGEERFNATDLAPDTEYQISTRTIDTAGNLNQTWVNATARTASVQPTPTPTSSSSGGGGSGGNSRTSAASTKPLLPEQQSSLSFKGTAIYVINVTAADATRNLLFTVEDAGSLPAGIPRPDDETYCIEHVEQYRTNDNDIATATIRFSVSKAWLDERGYRFSDIVLLRFHNGAWTRIPTTFEGEKDGYYYYSAETPGFSYFAIVYQENGTIVLEVTAPAREAAVDTPTTSEPTRTTPKATRTNPAQSPSAAFGTLGTLLAIAATCGAARIRKR